MHEGTPVVLQDIHTEDPELVKENQAHWCEQLSTPEFWAANRGNAHLLKLIGLLIGELSRSAVWQDKIKTTALLSECIASPDGFGVLVECDLLETTESVSAWVPVLENPVAKLVKPKHLWRLMSLNPLIFIQALLHNRPAVFTLLIKMAVGIQSYYGQSDEKIGEIAKSLCVSDSSFNSILSLCKTCDQGGEFLKRLVDGTPKLFNVTELYEEQADAIGRETVIDSQTYAIYQTQTYLSVLFLLSDKCSELFTRIKLDSRVATAVYENRMTLGRSPLLACTQFFAKAICSEANPCRKVWFCQFAKMPPIGDVRLYKNLCQGILRMEFDPFDPYDLRDVTPEFWQKFFIHIQGENWISAWEKFGMTKVRDYQHLFAYWLHKMPGWVQAMFDGHETLGETVTVPFKAAEMKQQVTLREYVRNQGSDRKVHISEPPAAEC